MPIFRRLRQSMRVGRLTDGREHPEAIMGVFSAACRRTIWAAAGAVALCAAAAVAQSNAPAARFRASAVNLDNLVGRTGVETVEIVVDRWSTEAEGDRLLSILRDQGPSKLLDALHDLPRVGYIRTPDSIGYELHFARATPGEDGGEQIVIATDRYISFWEASNRPRTIEYPFTVIEMRLDRDGTGEGKMSIATKITADRKGQTIVLENYGTQPVLLNNVRRSK